MTHDKRQIAIHTEPVPEGSYRVYIYLNGGSYENRDHIDTTCLFSPQDDGVYCHFVKGILSDEINMAIIQKAHEMGYEKMYFTRPAGNCATRRGEYLKTEDGLDYWVVDIKQLMKR